MKNLILMFIFLFASLITSAQEKNTENDSLSIHGIQFQLPNILTIDNFNGYTFSYRYRKTKTSGYRFSLFTNIDVTSTERTYERNTSLYDAPYSNNNYKLKISAQYLKTIVSHKDISFIVGGGPLVSYNYEKENILWPFTNKTRTRDTYSRKFGVGLDLLTGIEYQLYNNVVISGEYNLTMLWERTDFEQKDYTTYKDNNSDGNTNIGITNKINLYGNRVTFGVTIYF